MTLSCLYSLLLVALVQYPGPVASQAEQEVPKPTKLFVVGGKAGGALTASAAVLDLSGKNTTCPKIPSYPTIVYGHVGEVVDGQIVVCGGCNRFNELLPDCYIFDRSTNEWVLSQPLLEVRFNAATVKLSQTEWWITGGLQRTRPKATDTTEIKTIGEAPQAYVDLPVDKQGHQLVQVNETHFVLAGDTGDSTDAWIFDAVAKTWSRLPDIPEASAGFQAGAVRFANGSQCIVVAGGWTANISYALNLDDLAWRPLPLLPELLHWGTVVPYGDTFLIAGGVNLPGFTWSTDTIYMFHPELEDWVLSPQRLDMPRRDFAAFFVPDDYFECV